MIENLIGFLKEKDIEFTEYEDLSQLSYMKLGGAARLSLSPKSEADFCKIVFCLRNRGIRYKVVGKMSNILPSDTLYDGVLVRTHKMRKKSPTEYGMHAECGASLAEIIWSCAQVNLGGAEELFMIPASLGGAVFNNAGAYGKTISDVLISARIYNPESNTVEEYHRDEMLFSYRSSVFQHCDRYLLSASLGFEKSDFNVIRDKIQALAEKRRSSQPLEFPSLGSIFKQCNGLSAGYYIDKAGLKGCSFGGAMISPKHAGFIINTGGATSREVKELIEIAKTRVKECFGITLEEEIEIM